MRIVRRAEDGIAMLTALLLITIITAIAVAVSGLIIAETRPTQVARKNAQTYDAAQGGIDAALNKIRASNDGAGNGIRIDLPCSTNNADTPTLTGSVSGNSGSLTYAVRIRYYTSDPENQPASWLNDSANMIDCSAGYPAGVPSFAYIESTGLGAAVSGQKSAAAGNRTLHTVYNFSTTNANTQGGRMIENGTGSGTAASPGLCMQVNTTYPNPPKAGDGVILQTCVTTSTATNFAYQQFSYGPPLGTTTNLLIEWTGTANSNLCLSPTSSQSAGQAIVLATCSVPSASDPAPWTTTAYANQAFGFDGNGHFVTTNSSNGRLGSLCLSSANGGGSAGVAGQPVYLETCSGAQDYMAWNPDTTTGAGEAGATLNYLVNYKEFARCLDITHANVNAGWIIDYPCKQEADTADIAATDWNQIFYYNATTGAVYTINGGTNYCLTPTTSATASSPPNVNVNQTPSSGYVVVASSTSCNPTSSVGANQKWTETGNTGDYQTGYEVKNNISGLCLAIEQPGPSNLASSYDQQWGMAVVETCNGGLNQKWNAPANLVANPLTGTGEDLGGKTQP